MCFEGNVYDLNEEMLINISGEISVISFDTAVQ